MLPFPLNVEVSSVPCALMTWVQPFSAPVVPRIEWMLSRLPLLVPSDEAVARAVVSLIRTCRDAAVVPTAMIAPPAASDTVKPRSEEHTSELQSLMRISYAVFCLHKKNTHTT